ncbi:MAG: HDOD domain-containing protein [Desulfobulbaceae bacterium]|nr:HDOD domain-containing protein [Desulfobulbaceae bacterium]
MQKNLSFVDVIKQYIEAGNIVLPVLSSAAMRVQQELVKKEPEMKVLEGIISKDQSLSSQVLQMANSAFYHGLVEVKTIRAAVVRLGMREVGRITLLAASKNQFRSKNKALNIIMHRLWQHSVGCALGVQWLSKRCKFEELECHAFFAGLFHDIGKLFVLMVIDQMKEKNKDLPLTQSLLMEAMIVLHTQQGYNLMKQWNMPEEYSVIARDHHNQDFDSKNDLLVLVRLSNMACHKLGIGLKKEPSLVLSAGEEALHLNLSEIDLAELEILLEDTAILAG